MGMCGWVCVRGCFYCRDDGERALCRQPVLILWPPPQLQHVGNKPFSSNLQTVQQSMGNYLSQSMGQPFCFTRSLPLLLSYLYPFLPPPTSPPSPPPHPFCLIFAVSLFFPPTPSLPPSLPPCFHLHSLQLSGLGSTYSEMRQLSSSRAINKSRPHPRNM